MSEKHNVRMINGINLKDRETVIRCHRRMWKDIANLMESKAFQIYVLQFFVCYDYKGFVRTIKNMAIDKRFHIPGNILRNNCFACEYTGGVCGDCPFNWTPKCDRVCFCMDPRSPYKKFVNIFGKWSKGNFDKFNFTELQALAMEIANLPEKPQSSNIIHC